VPFLTPDSPPAAVADPVRSVTIEPKPRAWEPGDRPGGILFDHPLEEWRRLTREEVGLPRAGLVVATGHQADWWHPGVLAKYHALDAFAAARAAESVRLELVVDQDANDPTRLAVPIRRPDDEGGIEEVVLADEPGQGRPTGMLPPMRIDRSRVLAPAEGRGPAGRPLTPTVADGLRRLVAAFDASTTTRGKATTTRAEQVADVLDALRGVPARDPRRVRITTTDLTRTTLWRAVVANLRSDPDRAWATYGEAVRADPGAGVRPLAERSASRELPLWRIDEAGRRHAAWSDNLADGDAGTDADGDGVGKADPTRFRPRALLMTGLVRMVLGDLFIHGTGGFRYDAVTERWFAAWLGVRLAPMTCVTATVRLAHGGRDVTRDDLARARWRRHHLRHHPAELLDDHDALAKRARLLAEIDEAPWGSTERESRYRTLHAWLAAYRKRHEDDLRSLDAEVTEVERALAARAVAESRTWPFFLHAPAVLRNLHDRLTDAFSS